MPSAAKPQHESHVPRHTRARLPGGRLILVGGGLQNGLIALAALAADPRRELVLIEQAGALGGNHTWCLHARDVPEDARPWIEPLIVERWSGYDVRFPRLRRSLPSPYAVISSERFASVLHERLLRADNVRLLLGRRAVRVDAHEVELEDGSVERGALVIDARGPSAPSDALGPCGFQKFVGVELALARPHGLARPLLMDACVPQQDGFRFMYVLPLDGRRLLVEDTRFSRHPELDVGALRDEAFRYAETLGPVHEVLRSEQGVLPMPWSLPRPRPQPRAPLAAGYRGGYFHPATGYSLPVALRLAQVVAAHPVSLELWRALHALHHAHVEQARFCERLNRLLFCAFRPAQMWNVFERFYRLPPALIERFYAMSLGKGDRARIVLGRPPRGISLSAAWSLGRP